VHPSTVIFRSRQRSFKAGFSSGISPIAKRGFPLPPPDLPGSKGDQVSASIAAASQERVGLPFR
jgi:hypothetical protein